MTKKPLDPARCPQLSPSGRQCLVLTGTGEHEHRYTAPRQEVPPLGTLLSGGKLTAATVISGNKVSKRAYAGREIKRDQIQLQVDNDAKANAAANRELTAARPLEEFTAVVKYTVPLKAVEATLAYIRRAGGTGGTVTGKVMKYRKETHSNGNVSIQWGYVDPDPNKK